MNADGWLVSGGGHSVYAVRVDDEVQHQGHATLALEPTTETAGKYGTWMRSIDARPFRGKRVRISVYTRTEGATQRADFWARVQAIDSPGDGSGLHGEWVPLPAYSGWTYHEVVFDVPDGGDRLQYGVGIAGPGRLWVDGAEAVVVGVAGAT